VSPNCVKSGMGKHKHKKADEERNEGGVQEDEVQEAKEADTSQLQSETTKPYEELVTLMAPIAKPLASKKLTRKLYKAVRKAQKAKRLKRGVREVVKGLRKDGEGGSDSSRGCEPHRRYIPHSSLLRGEGGAVLLCALSEGPRKCRGNKETYKCRAYSD